MSLKKGPMQLYIITITMSFFSLILPTVGMETRDTEESEILLVILGAFGFFVMRHIKKST